MASSCCTARSKCSGKKTDVDVNHRVYPLHALDQPIESQTLLTWVLCFNDVLNADKLHASLCQLLEIGDWRKLASRLRVGADGLVEAYVPDEFNAEHPACVFFHAEHLHSNIQCHPVGRHFSFPARRAFTQSYASENPSALFHPEFPMRVKDLIDRKWPQLILQVLSFYDATVVTISWPGNTLDDVSLRALLDNWSLVLAGRSKEVVTVLGTEKDIVEELVARAEEKGPLVHCQRMEPTTWAQYLLPAWCQVRSQPRLQRRMVYIPEIVYDEFVSEIRADLSVLSSDDEDERLPNVSDADIVFAWVSKLQGQGKSAPRAVTGSRSINMRRGITPLRYPSGEYLQNLTIPVYSELSPRDMKKSTAELSLKHKRCVDNQISADQLLASAKDLMEKKAHKSAPVWPGDASASRLEFCDLTALRLFSAADFGPAVIRQGDITRPRFNVTGTMIAAYSLQMDAQPTEAACKVIGIDADGNFWMCCQLEASVWIRMEEELYRLQKCINSPISGTSMRFRSTKGR